MATSRIEHPRPTRPPSDHGPIRFDVVPKPGGGQRRLARLDARDARRYALAVQAVVADVERSLSPSVVANRASSVGSVALEDWKSARARFRAGVLAHGRRTGAVAVGDVADCYGSMHPRMVVEALRAFGVGPARARRVGTVLADLQDRGVRGLPIGPEASAILANAVLHAVDRAMRGASVAYLRWVDDVVMFQRDQASAVRALDAFHRSLADIGLRANEAKTTVLDPAQGCHALTGHALIGHALIGGSISLAGDRCVP